MSRRRPPAAIEERDFTETVFLMGFRRSASAARAVFYTHPDLPGRRFAPMLEPYPSPAIDHGATLQKLKDALDTVPSTGISRLPRWQPKARVA